MMSSSAWVYAMMALSLVRTVAGEPTAVAPYTASISRVGECALSIVRLQTCAINLQRVDEQTETQAHATLFETCAYCTERTLLRNGWPRNKSRQINNLNPPIPIQHQQIVIA